MVSELNFNDRYATVLTNADNLYHLWSDSSDAGSIEEQRSSIREISLSLSSAVDILAGLYKSGLENENVELYIGLIPYLLDYADKSYKSREMANIYIREAEALAKESDNTGLKNMLYGRASKIMQKSSDSYTDRDKKNNARNLARMYASKITPLQYANNL